MVQRSHKCRHNKLSLLSIRKSPKQDKKLRATFCRQGRIKHVDFGAAGIIFY